MSKVYNHHVDAYEFCIETSSCYEISAYADDYIDLEAIAVDKHKIKLNATKYRSVWNDKSLSVRYWEDSDDES